MDQIQLRRGTAAEWTAANPILAAGEPAVETDTGRLKLGNGATAWTALPYLADHLSASAKRTTSQALPSDTNSILSFDTEVHDTGGLFTTAAPTVFTIPAGAGGRYLFTGQTAWSDNGGGTSRNLSIMKNGATSVGKYFQKAPSGIAMGVDITAVLQLVPTDTVSLMVYHNAGAVINTYVPGSGFTVTAMSLVRIGV